jgi:hypothetical protein
MAHPPLPTHLPKYAAIKSTKRWARLMLKSQRAMLPLIAKMRWPITGGRVMQRHLSEKEELAVPINLHHRLRG